MASSFKLTLDTTPPAFTALLGGGLPVTGTEITELKLLLEDAGLEEPLDPAAYQYRIYGDVDPAYDPDIQEEKEESSWVNHGEAIELLREIKLSEGDGAKTIFVEMRDDVWNVATPQELSIELNTSAAVITITSGPTPAKISQEIGKNLSTFQFKSSEDLNGWETWVVPSSGTAHEAGGTHIVAGSGSEDIDGGELEAEKNQTVIIAGGDLLAAVGGVDAEYTIKVFGLNKAGNWSL